MIKHCARSIVICCFTMIFSLFSTIYYTGDEQVVLMSEFESKNSFISYVTINGYQYIIKQKKNIQKQMAAVRDALAAYIAQDLGIAHSVQIISVTQDIAGKVNKQQPATLHTIAAGKAIIDQPESRYYKLRLKQRSPEDDLLPNRWLTEAIIYQMTWHKQLPLIVALDLFIGNIDRHGGNLFYDPVTDCFCAIDMDNIFRFDLPALACQKLDAMVSLGKNFTNEEIIALTSVRDTLQFLLRRFTSTQIIDQLHLFVQQAGLRKNNIIKYKSLVKKITNHEAMIIKSRKSVHKLIYVLDKIIDNFSN
ncbi:MAG TPA: hypothetical protein VKR54_02965 [Candidatus Babeliales bacterium]|nr:hypothetical protein [Candidatus Babeliales bacterium]